MLKILLYGVIIYLGYRAFKYLTSDQISLSGDDKADLKEKSSEEYSKFDIQDADFTDIED